MMWIVVGATTRTRIGIRIGTTTVEAVDQQKSLQTLYLLPLLLPLQLKKPTFYFDSSHYLRKIIEESANKTRTPKRKRRFEYHPHLMISRDKMVAIT